MLKNKVKEGQKISSKVEYPIIKTEKICRIYTYNNTILENNMDYKAERWIQAVWLVLSHGIMREYSTVAHVNK